MSRFLITKHRPWFSATLPLAAAIAALVLLWPPRRLRSENFVFYFPHHHKVIPMQTVGGVQYLPLIPLLNLRGEVGGLEEKSNSLKVWVGGDQLQFHLNQKKVQINKTAVMLSAPMLRVNGEWVAPENFLNTVFARLPGSSVVYRPGASRAFLGGVQPITYTAHLANEPSGARLTIQFTGEVSAETASRNGKWVIFLENASVEPLEHTIHFQNPYLVDLRFDDQDGRPKLIITPKVAGLDFYPSLSHDQQTLTADFRSPTTAAAKVPAGQHPASAGAPAAAPVTAGKTAPGAAQPAAAPAPPPPPPLPVVVLDAGHGGSDSGARSRDGILEKNLAAALVARVSSALQAAHKFQVILTRAGDSDPTFEERTLTANTAHPALFLTFHAGEMGNIQPVVRVYTYQPSSPWPQRPSGAASGLSLFVPWDLAQRPQTDRSRQLASDLQAKFAAISGATAPAPIQAPVRQLRSIAAPAVAIELGSLSPAVNAGILNQPAFQQQVANAAVVAVEQFVGGAAKP